MSTSKRIRSSTSDATNVHLSSTVRDDSLDDSEDNNMSLSTIRLSSWSEVVTSSGGKRLRIAIEMGSGIVDGKLLTDDDDDRRLLRFLLTLLLLLLFMLLRLVSVLDVYCWAMCQALFFWSKSKSVIRGHRSHFSFSIFTS